MRVRPRVEERGHQRVAVGLTAKVQRLAVLPAPLDCLDGLDHLAHARDGGAPRHRVPVLDVRADLRSETEREAPARKSMEAVRRLGQIHRVARERDRDACEERGPRRVLCRQGKREEGLVRSFGGVQAVEPHRLELTGDARHVRQRATQVVIDQHEKRLTLSTIAAPGR
jgi:hypothetical protein